MPEIEVTILNWEKYHPRKDVSNPSWFRFQNRTWNDSQFFSFTAEERWIWVCLLSMASQKNSAVLEFSTEWLSIQSGASVVTIENALEKLSRNACVTCAVRPRTQTLRARNVRGRNITDITNITDKTNNITKDTKSCDSVSIKKPSRDSKKVGTDKVIAIYCAAYDSRYQARPEIDGKTIGLVKSLLKTHSPEKLSDLIKAYLQMDDPWFKTKNHDFPTFRENLTKISTAMQTGSNLSAEPKRPKIYHDELWKPWVEPDDRG